MTTDTPVANDALPEPVGYLSLREAGLLASGHTAMLRSAKFGPSKIDYDAPVYTADQLRAAVAAERSKAQELEQELAICRDAIETCYEVAEKLPSDADHDAAVRRCTLRRLNEAIGKATPRLLGERPEGQKMYGLHWREMNAELSTLRQQLADEREHQQNNIDNLRQQLAEAVRDAERYLYLRNRAPESVLGVSGRAAGCWIDCDNDLGTVLVLLTGHDADAAIDTAIAIAAGARQM